jgi:DNA-binding CsgD family transcriptional regulator
MGSDFVRTEPLRRALELIHQAREIGGGIEQRLHLARGIESVVGAAMVVLAKASRAGDDWFLDDYVSTQSQEPAQRMMSVLTRRGLGFSPGLRASLGLARSPSIVAMRRRDVLGDAEWYESEYFNDVRRKAGFDDFIYAMHQETPGRMSGVAFARELRDRPFSEEERNLIHLFHEELTRLDAAPPAGAGDPTLTPRQRDVLHWLLAGAGEKQAAAELGISQQTLHAHVKSIYATYGVSSRAELLVRCLTTRRRALP